MRCELIAQIDVDHWTVVFLDGKWQGMKGDYKIVHAMDLDDGQTVEVEPSVIRKEPTTKGYCGTLEAKAVLKSPKKK